MLHHHIRPNEGGPAFMAMTPNGLQSIEEMFVPTYGDGTLVCLYDYVCLSVCMYVC